MTVAPGQRVTSTVIGVPPWTGLSLQNGWTNSGGGYTGAQWRYWPLLNEVELMGFITAGTLTDGTQVAVVPSFPVSTLPVSEQELEVRVDVSSGTPGVLTPRLYIDTLARLKVYSLPAGTVNIGFHGWYSLDA